MTVKIVIECEDVYQLDLHMNRIKDILSKTILKREADGNTKNFSISDNNCYGTHDVEVILNSDNE